MNRTMPEKSIEEKAVLVPPAASAAFSKHEARGRQ
jgi:hypothetical protein